MTSPHSGTRYRVNAPKVAADTIDGEVVIINFESGNYYSLLGAAADIWAALEATATDAGVVAAVTAAYDGDADAMASAAESFLAELQAEGLVVEVTDDAPTPEPGGDAASAHGNGSRAPFVAPTLERFEDLQDLILLDPVHEVEEGQGWPYPKTDQ